MSTPAPSERERAIAFALREIGGAGLPFDRAAAVAEQAIREREDALYGEAANAIGEAALPGDAEWENCLDAVLAVLRGNQ